MCKLVKDFILLFITLVILGCEVSQNVVGLRRFKRVVNGTLSKEGQWPFLVSIKNPKMRQLWETTEPIYMDWQNVGNDSHICGAALISDQWIVSALHCLECHNQTILKGWTAAVGAYNLLHKSSNEQVIPIDSFIFPDTNSAFQDLVFMRLQYKIKPNKYAQPICIKQQPLNESNLECFGMGWGTNVSIFENPVSKLPKYFKAKYIQNVTECIPQPRTTESLCFGPINGLGCRGDSGGPMVCRNNASQPWQLVGVTSSGTGCNTPTDRIIYMNVSYFLHYLPNELQNVVVCNQSNQSGMVWGYMFLVQSFLVLVNLSTQFFIG